MDKMTAEWKVELQSEERSFACECSDPGHNRLYGTGKEDEPESQVEGIVEAVRSDGQC